MPSSLQKRNIIELVSGICNVYAKSSTIKMYTGAHDAHFVPDHQSNNPSSSPTGTDTMVSMKKKFSEWGVNLQWVVLFPHIDDFNGRDLGQNWLGAVSRTLNVSHHVVGTTTYLTKRREVMTFCQRKVNEDMHIRETCVIKIHEVMACWMSGLGIQQRDENVLATSIHSTQMEANALINQPTHRNKCMYYSIFASDHRHLADYYDLGFYRQVESLSCLMYVNGPDKYHLFFQMLLSCNALPSDVICAEFVRFCNNESSGNSVMSQGEAVCHRPHWMKPYLKAEMLYGLRVLLSIFEDSNSGILTRDDAFKRMKEVKFLGDLTGTHLFAVAVLRGLLINREYLTKPSVPLTLCNAVRKHLFEDDKSITNERIWKATEMASENLGLLMIAGDHALC
jgi:hypothetical protein